MSRHIFIGFHGIVESFSGMCNLLLPSMASKMFLLEKMICTLLRLTAAKNSLYALRNSTTDVRFATSD